jgi:3-hydroxyisobutyrate dehydrogenase-like beta-hydroxyacid dehydrogenase
MKVGWIGLGGIGAQMALRVLGAGHELVAYARGQGKEAVAGKGGELVSDYGEVAANCDVLGVCVFNDVQLRESLIDGGALAALKPGAVLAVHTTGSPKLAKALAERAPEGAFALDACFSGGQPETAEGRLTLMIGGEAAALETARPVLSTYASNLFHVGPAGAGQTIKLLNNLLFATNVRYAVDVIDAARAQGLDPQEAAKVIQASSGASMAMGLFANAPPQQFLKAIRHYMVKDVQAAESAALDAGFDLSAFQPILDYYR